MPTATETAAQPDDTPDPATFLALVLLDSGFEIDDIDWQSISDFRRYALGQID